MTGGKQLHMASLPQLSQAELKEEWARRFGALAPAIASDLLRLGLGYKIQAQRHGALSREAKSLLKQHAQLTASGLEPTQLPRKLMPGTKLVRDWHGVGHTVTVLEKGFEYDGQTWRSLTAVARAITGSHWNGPRFFGLT